MDAGPPEKRIGDRERREVDDRLCAAMCDGVLTLTEYDERAAQCWAARTRTDLDVLTIDLPDPVGEVRAEPAPTVREPPPSAPARRGHDDGRGHGLVGRIGSGVVTSALIAAGLYAAVGVLGASDGASIFGSRTMQVTDTQSQVDVGTLFGSTRVVVPDGTRVVTGGTIVFGSIDCDQACTGVAPGAREVTVDARGGFGSVDVLTATEAATRGSDNDRDDD